MAWSLRAVGDIATNNDNSALNVSVPTGVQAGDLLVLVGYHVEQCTFAGTSGTWYGAFNSYYIPDTNDPATIQDTLQVWTKLAGSSESTVTLAPSVSYRDDDTCAAYMLAFDGIGSRGIDWQALAGTFGVNLSTLGSISPQYPQDLILMLVAQADPNANFASDSAGNLTGISEILGTHVLSGGTVYNVQNVNSSFELDYVDTNGWSTATSGCANTPTWSRTGTNAVDGSYAGRLQYTANAGDTVGIIGLAGILSGVGTVSPGQTMAVGINLKGVATGCDVRIGVRWYDSAGNYLTRSMTTQTINNSAMNRYTKISSAAPANTSQGQLYLMVENIASGDSVDLYFDCAQLEMGDTANSYNASGGSGLSLGAYTATKTTAGATGNPTLTSDTSDTNVMVTAILPFRIEDTLPDPGTPGPTSGGIYAYSSGSWRKVVPKAWSGGVWNNLNVKARFGYVWRDVISGSDGGGVTPPLPPPPSGTFNAVTEGDSGNRCHNDGSSDDLAHLNAQASAALAAGKSLYLPGGTGYKLSNKWSIPAGLLVIGDGPTSSKVLGLVGWRSNIELRGLRIGTYTTSAMEPSGTTTAYENVIVRNCRLRAGGTPTVNGNYGALKIKNISFIDSEFECPHTVYGVGGQAHELCFMIDASMGGYWDGINVTRCHFGLANDYGETITQYGHIITYCHNMTGSGYGTDLNITDSVFELSYQWGLDFAPYNDNPRLCPVDYPYARFYIARNEFRGSGAIKNGSDTPEFPWTLDIEPCVGGVIEDNVFWTSSSSAVRTTYNTRNVIVRNNHFDWRQSSGVTPYTSSDTWNSGATAANYMTARQLRFYDGGANEAYGNHLYLPVQYQGQQTNNGWISIEDGDLGYPTSTAHDNYVYFGGTPGDLGG